MVYEWFHAEGVHPGLRVPVLPLGEGDLPLPQGPRAVLCNLQVGFVIKRNVKIAVKWFPLEGRP
jgi:hypothetical protein